MNRRSFVRNSAAVAAGVSLAAPALAAPLLSNSAAKHGASQRVAGEPFQLNYAPHQGMFAQHGGPKPVDQLRFMADEGFRSFEGTLC